MDNNSKIKLILDRGSNKRLYRQMEKFDNMTPSQLHEWWEEYRYAEACGNTRSNTDWSHGETKVLKKYTKQLQNNFKNNEDKFSI